METQTFVGATFGDAYEQVRAAFGQDALIISTQTSPRLGGVSHVEVVAGLPEAPSGRWPGLANDLAAHELVRAVAEDLATSPALDPADSLGAAWPEPADPPLEGLEPAVNTYGRTAPGAAPDALLAAIAERTRTIESTVHWLASRRAHAVVDEGPEGLHELRSRLVDHGVGERVLVPLIQRLESQVRPDASVREVLRIAERTLAALLPPPPRIDIGRAGHVIYVVGPRGAGKTTLTLRLAREVAGGRRAIIAGTDVDRAGAPQQLLAAAAAAGVEARLCYAPAELRELVREAAGNVVIVDTAGHSGARGDRMLELKAYAQVAPSRSTLLALPATIGAADAVRVATAFAPLGLSGLVATHVDEGVAFGGVLSAVLGAGVGLAYTTASEHVSAGLALGDNHALSLAVLTGIWPGPAVVAQGSVLGAAA